MNADDSDCKRCRTVRGVSLKIIYSFGDKLQDGVIFSIGPSFIENDVRPRAENTNNLQSTVIFSYVMSHMKFDQD